MNKSIYSKYVFYFFLFFSIFTLDRISKIYILNIANNEELNIYINEFLNIILIWNTGIGFGLLSSNSSLLYNLMSLIIGSVIIILIYVGLMSEKFDKLIYSIIIGGALGNFYDRLSNKAVPDFIDLHYNNFHWFTFNVADIFITLGILAFILRNFCIKK